MDRLTEIFAHQATLARRFHIIECGNGTGWGAIDQVHLLEWPPEDLDNPQVQSYLKHLAWHIIEEVAEAINERILFEEKWFKVRTGSGSAPLDIGPFLYQKEMADALHFMVELLLAAGIDSATTWINIVVDDYRTPGADMLDDLFTVIPTKCNDLINTNEAVTNFLVAIGMTMNILKNRPWKRETKKTNIAKFKSALNLTFKAWVTLARTMDMSANLTYELYFDMANKNNKRLEATGD